MGAGQWLNSASTVGPCQGHANTCSVATVRGGDNEIFELHFAIGSYMQRLKQHSIYHI